jgi:hypothetical protein
MVNVSKFIFLKKINNIHIYVCLDGVNGFASIAFNSSNCDPATIQTPSVGFINVCSVGHSLTNPLAAYGTCDTSSVTFPTEYAMQQ